MAAEKAIIMPNPPGDADWVVGWCLLHRSGALGSAKCIFKKILGVIPILGWSFAMSESVFLARKWDTDQERLERGFKVLHEYEQPWTFGIFPEGTRAAPGKIAESQAYARKQGLPVLEHVLLPRKRGFVSTVQNLRDSADAVYDITIQHPCPGVLACITGAFREGESREVHIEVKRHAMDTLPLKDEELGNWCLERFVEKDTVLAHCKAKGQFKTPVVDIPQRRSCVIFSAMWIVVVLTLSGCVVLKAVSGSTFWSRFAGVVTFMIMAMAITALQMSKTGDAKKKDA
jgi:lysocardiolipin and lysophospholipid acyltransferase